MRLTLGLIPLACALACTLDNPAFLTITDPSASSSGAATMGAVSMTDGGGGGSTDTQPATTASSEPTTGPGTSAGSGTTSTSTTGTSTTGNNTTLPETSTSDPVSTSEPGGTTIVALDMGGPNLCVVEDLNHVSAPFVRPVNALNVNEQISGATCNQFANMLLKGKLFIYPDGFSVKADPGCGSLMGQPSIKFPLTQWMLDANKVVGNGLCVQFKFESHPQYLDHCAIASVSVFQGLTPLIGGRFGTANLATPFDNVTVSAEPKGLCTCAGCCPEAPDPDSYTLSVNQIPVPQGAPPVEFIPTNSPKHYFVNFRSDVHPECPQFPDKPDWLHFDWVIARAL